MATIRDTKAASASVLRAERARRGWTQEQAAKASGVAVGSLKAYEIGAREIGFSNACKLADCYGVSLDTLAGRGTL
jgi:transcriptional regulator with XRE-family HTH domain